jgi:D-tagatose-1,6-bisphosphate aldolase subunit GatZ/KbaZ
LVILGGDHLGPLTWQNEPEESAMEKSGELIRGYVAAGFTKIHIDTSMMLPDDDKNEKLSDSTIARRAARLAGVSEEAYASLRALDGEAPTPVYVIGSEVPIPGGARGNDDDISVTTAGPFEQTWETFEREFAGLGLAGAADRIIGVVVQPGVEFSDETVTPYDRDRAKELCACLKKHPGIVFEGHSTDYQTKACLKQMVEDGIAILKVGPALTYALRQALFALNDIENELLAGKGRALSGFRETLEEAMLSNPGYWEKYYHDDDVSSASIKRKYSFSDRCRYYLPEKEVAAATEILLANIDGIHVPLSLLEQYMPIQYTHIREGRLRMDARAIIKDRVKDYIDDYLFAVM